MFKNWVLRKQFGPEEEEEEEVMGDWRKLRNEELHDLYSPFIIQVIKSRRTRGEGGDHGGTVVKVLCYKLEGRWFDPSWCHWNFSLT